MAKPTLLLVTPNTPATTGGGTAMRSGMFLEAYAADFDVTLLVLRIYSEGTVDHAFLSSFCKEVRVVSPDAGAGPEIMLDAQGRRFDVMHVSRLTLALVLRRSASAAGRSAPYVVLDVDDFESKRAARFAALFEMVGEHEAAASERAYGASMAALERKLLPHFHCLFMTHDADVAELSQLYGLRTARTVPNVVRVPIGRRPLGDPATPTLTFFGSLNYWPNIDGISWFCSEVLPELRRIAEMPFRVIVAGVRPHARVEALAAPDVSIVGPIDDVDALYARSSVMLVPLRAGAGTRIKILEAMSYARPTVSTSIGAEGLAIPAGAGVLIADDGKEFARQCAALLRDPTLRARVGDAGFEWVSRYHTIEQFKTALRESMASYWS